MKHLLSALTLFTALAIFPVSAMADSWWECTPIEVMDLGGRLHVRCSNTITMGSDVVRYLAISTADADQAARFISLGNAALLSGKSFRVYIRTSSSTNVSGCLTSDCRTPTAFGVRN